MINIPKLPIGETLRYDGRTYLGTKNGNVDISKTKGGFHQVFNSIERNEISEELREEGMWVYVYQEDMVYKLIGGTTNDCWKPYESKKMFEQNVASLEWVFEHNLGYFPNSIITDGEGYEIKCLIQHKDKNTIICYFNIPTTGTITLS